MGILDNAKQAYINYKKLRYKDSYPIIKVNNKNVVFVHILKTAGTSLINAIDQDFKLHLPVTEIIRRVGDDNFKQAFSFSFVRNPWDKVYSHYKYNIKTNQHLMKSNSISFNVWVKKCFGEEKDYFYYHRQIQFTDQLTWLKNVKGEIAVDFIGKFETIDKDFNFIEKELQLKNGLPHLNKTLSVDYREQYNQESCDLIAKVFKADIDYFNYSF
jgi:hypothetical protein